MMRYIKLISFSFLACKKSNGSQPNPNEGQANPERIGEVLDALDRLDYL